MDPVQLDLTSEAHFDHDADDIDLYRSVEMRRGEIKQTGAAYLRLTKPLPEDVMPGNPVLVHIPTRHHTGGDGTKVGGFVSYVENETDDLGQPTGRTEVCIQIRVFRLAYTQAYTEEYDLEQGTD